MVGWLLLNLSFRSFLEIVVKHNDFFSFFLNWLLIEAQTCLVHIWGKKNDFFFHLHKSHIMWRFANQIIKDLAVMKAQICLRYIWGIFPNSTRWLCVSVCTYAMCVCKCEWACTYFLECMSVYLSICYIETISTYLLKSDISVLLSDPPTGMVVWPSDVLDNHLVEERERYRQSL